MKKVLYLFIASVILTSCSKQQLDEVINKTIPEITAAAKTTLEALKKNEPAQSEKVHGTETRNNKSLETITAQILDLTDAGRLIYNSLVGNSAALKGSTNSNLEGWYIESVNGQAVDSKDFTFFFDSDGTYYVLDNSEQAWNWGFYYTDIDFNTLAFDLNDDNEEIWTIKSITDSELLINDGSSEIKLVKYDLTDYDEEEYTNTELQEDLTERVWFLTNNYTDGNLDAFEEETDNSLEAFYFSNDNTFGYVEFTVIYDPTGDSISYEVKQEISGNWALDNGLISLNYEDPVDGTIDLDLDITYLFNGELGLFTGDKNNSYEFDFLSEDRLIEEVAEKRGRKVFVSPASRSKLTKSLKYRM